MLNIATHFGVADYCIPLTLYYRALYDVGALTEWTMRAPLLLGGIGLLVFAPWSLRRSVPLPTRSVWLALLAISPVLMYLTRTARPYALSGTLALVAIVAFLRWYHDAPQARRWAWLYVLATVAAGWLQLLTLTFTLTPFLLFGVLALWRLAHGQTREGLGMLRRLLVFGLLTVAPLALLLLPPLINDWGALVGKAGRGAVTWDSAWRTALMLFGVGGPVVAGLLTALTAWGVVRFSRRQPALTACFLLIMAIATTTIIVAQPAWIEHPGVLARYVMPGLPLLLLFLAEGLLAAAQWLLPRYLTAGVAALALAGLFAVGPLPKLLYWPNQFMGHTRFQYDYDPLGALVRTRVKLGTIPPFYFELARQPPRSLTVIQGPWRPESYFIPQPWYQQLHRQYVKIAMVSPTCGPGGWADFPATFSGIHLTQFVHLSDVLRGADEGADLLVLRMRPWLDVPPQRIRWPDMRQCLARVEAWLGPPFYRDPQIAVFALSPAGTRVARDQAAAGKPR